MMKSERMGTDSTITGRHFADGRPVRLEIRDGLIAGVIETRLEEEEDIPLYIAPGLIDNQINGFANVDFSGDNLSAEDVVRASEAIWKTGVTTFLPTLITNSHINLVRNFRVLREALDNNELLRLSVPGFHLEGPYISPLEGFRGCHPEVHIRKPSWEEFMEYRQAAGGKIIQVTLAPETEGAIRFIRRCSDEGIVTSAGHTDLTADVLDMAAGNGLRLATHLGNGCANFIHRHQNPLWPLLANDNITPSIIADGQHLLPDEYRVFLRVKGSGKLILTSDVMYLAGMAPGKYSFLGTEVLLTEEGMLKNVALNCLAGASFPLIYGVGNMMKFTGCSLEEAIGMATGNVAAVYGLSDRGSLTVGKRADIILFEKEGFRLNVRKTYINGELVFAG